METAVILHIIVLFFFGACVGSFLNVVIFRLPQGLSLLRPPSFCPACQTPISAADNIPIFGWLCLKGRARCCGAPISPRYPLVEFLTGALWALTGAMHALPHRGLYLDAGELTLWLVIVSLLIVVSFIDIDLQYIPDEISLGGCVLALAASTAMPFLHAEGTAAFPAVNPHLVSFLYSLGGMFCGFAATYILTGIGNYFMRRRLQEIQQKENADADTVLGMGDIKLMAFFGALFGWLAVFVIFVLATFFGALFGAAEKLRSGRPLPPPDSAADNNGAPGCGTAPAPRPGFTARLAHRWRTGNSVIPFGPYLCAAALTWLYARPSLTAAAAWWTATFWGR